MTNTVPTIIIRPIGLEAEANLLHIYQQCDDFLALGPACASVEMVLADLAESRQLNGIFCGIFNQSAEMIGVIDLIPDYNGTAFLSLLMIAAPYRGGGIGKHAVAWAEAYIRQYTTLQIMRSAVQVNHPKAIRFWQHMGYSIISAAQLQPDGTTTYLLEKSIAALRPLQTLEREQSMTSTQNLTALQEQFNRPNAVHFETNAAGLITAIIENPLAKGEMTLAGGQVTAYQPRNAAQDVLWMSPNAANAVGKSMRGGIPICWPWFAAHPTQPETMPFHGFARNLIWQVAETQALPTGATQIRMVLSQTAETYALWPHEFQVEAVATFGETFEMELVVHNFGTQAFNYTAALHSYFLVSDVEQVRVNGLEDTDYLDKTDQFQRKHQNGSIAFPEFTDRIYLNTVSDCVIQDPAWERAIRITKSGSNTTVVWNPGHTAANFPDVGLGPHRRFVCVETANAAEDVIQVAPGSQAHMRATISLEPIV